MKGGSLVQINQDVDVNYFKSLILDTKKKVDNIGYVD